MKNLFSLYALIVAPLALVGFAYAQFPSSDAMIEQLQAKPAATTAPRTRSMNGTRNLGVEAAALQETPVERASLSLKIQFDFNSAHIKPESGQLLTNLAIALQSAALLSSNFIIEGHTDAKGNTDYNQRLSQQRANAVRDFLVGQGISTARLSANGKGSSDLANKDDPQAAENRRVKIINVR